MNNTPKILNAGIIAAPGKVALILQRLGVSMEARIAAAVALAMTLGAGSPLRVKMSRATQIVGTADLPQQADPPGQRSVLPRQAKSGLTRCSETWATHPQSY